MFGFLSCHGLLNAFFTRFRSDDEETFCHALVEYTRACSHVGYPVREWRDSFPSCSKFSCNFKFFQDPAPQKKKKNRCTQLAIYITCTVLYCPSCLTEVFFCADDGCEESFVYRDCISCCPPTCTFEKECLGTNLHCLDGCYCPDGVFFFFLYKK